MSKKMAGILIAYGSGLGVLGVVAQRLAPALERVTLFTGLVGGGLCLLWGVVALAGRKGRAGATVSTVATALVLLSQAIHVWSVSNPDAGGSLVVRVLLTFMLLLTVGMVMYLLHGERTPEFYSRGSAPAKPTTSSRNKAL